MYECLRKSGRLAARVYEQSCLALLEAFLNRGRSMRQDMRRMMAGVCTAPFELMEVVTEP
jgi:hypothetical protein